MSMFGANPDFYPTPRHVARKMLERITNKEAKYFLEPSAGKGNIADVIRNPRTYEEFCEEFPELAERRQSRGYDSWRYGSEGRRVNIDVIENYPDLIQVLRGKEYDVVGFDWLTYEGVSYYDAIVMNPPFSEGAKHVLKAFDFLHAGEIVALLNAETIRNPYSEERKRLVQVIQEFGDVEYLGDCFSTAERKTDVEVALVYLKKSAPDDAADLWAKETTAEKHYDTDYDGDPCMLAIRDNLGNSEHWYNMANAHWMAGIAHIRKAKLYMDQNRISDHGGSREDSLSKVLELALSNVHTCRAEFLRLHRRKAWTSVFEQMEFGRWLDSKQQDRFMRDVQRDSTIPFTATNIKSTLENVFMSRKKLFDESVARVFDELCSHAVSNGSGPVAPESLKHNWRGSEGWKTNENFKVNKKLIFPRGVEYSYSGFQMPWGGDARTIYSDLDRILCVLDGKRFDDCYTIGQAMEAKCREVRDQTRAGGWTFESAYFLGRFYRVGTVHLTWKREDLWEAFNRTAAAGKKWLGEDTQQYRPKKRREDPDYFCKRNGHDFVDGVCTRCGDPEVDEVAAVECELCRAIFEHTGFKHCPIHETVPAGHQFPAPQEAAPVRPQLPEPQEMQLDSQQLPPPQEIQPAGIGFFSLSHSGVMVKSGNQCVTLTTENFTGERPAEVETLEWPVEGLELTFERPESVEAVGNAVKGVGPYAGVEVTFNDAPIPARDFLADALFVREVNGIRIGVFNIDVHHEWNFFGRQLVVPTPQLWGVVPVKRGKESLYTRIDVRDTKCVNLKLPDRSDVVRDALFDAVNVEAERTLFLYLASLPRHCATYREYERARELGIPLAEAIPYFQPFQPTTYDSDYQSEIFPARRYEPMELTPGQFALIDEGREQDGGTFTFAANQQFFTDRCSLPATLAGKTLVAKEDLTCYAGYSWAENVPELSHFRAVVDKRPLSAVSRYISIADEIILECQYSLAGQVETLRWDVPFAGYNYEGESGCYSLAVTFDSPWATHQQAPFELVDAAAFLSFFESSDYDDGTFDDQLDAFKDNASTEIQHVLEGSLVVARRLVDEALQHWKVQDALRAANVREIRFVASEKDGCKTWNLELVA